MNQQMSHHPQMRAQHHQQMKANHLQMGGNRPHPTGQQQQAKKKPGKPER
jgi:hypothetical protein